MGIASTFKTRTAPIYNRISKDDPLRDKEIQHIQIRYCHIYGAVADAALTLAARLTFTTSQAAHHHFVIATLECGTLVYIDKHSNRNIMVRPDRRGMSGGDQWLSSEPLKGKTCKFFAPDRITLDKLINFIENETSNTYHLIDDNCQHYADTIFGFTVTQCFPSLSSLISSMFASLPPPYSKILKPMTSYRGITIKQKRK